MLRCFPQADLHCLFDVLSPQDRRKLGYETSKTSFLQRMPGIATKHRLYLPLMPIAIEQLISAIMTLLSLVALPSPKGF